MGQYLFAATDPQGNSIQGAVNAEDLSDAVSQIARMGYSLLQVQAADAPQTTVAQTAPPLASTPTVGMAAPTQPPLTSGLTQAQNLSGLSQTQQMPGAARMVPLEPTQVMQPAETASAQDI